MPPIVRKLVIFAAVDGLLLSPHLHRGQQKPAAPILINYGTKEITSASGKDLKGLVSLEAHGIAGLFTVASSSYLVAISGRQQVAQVRGKAIYVITGVTLIPISSQIDATKAIESAQRAKAADETKSGDSDGESSEDEERAYQSVAEDVDEHAAISSADESSLPRTNTNAGDQSIAQDVFKKRGQYGRFAERWFSRKGWTSDKRRSQGMSIDGKTERPQDIGSVKEPDPEGKEHTTPQDQDRTAETLLPKLLRTTRLLLGSRSFYFSYDLDLTRRWGTAKNTNSELPLSKIVDPLFFWNRKLSASFTNAGQHAYVLPLLQGFVGQKAFTVEVGTSNSQPGIVDAIEDPKDVIELQDRATDQVSEGQPKTRDYLLTLISRRSVMRPGLRYLRRGVDEDGHVANAVETEQILSDSSWSPSSRVYSFTQIRGSIPLFFSQSPYSFKPVVVTQHSDQANHKAFKRHFDFIADRYGKIFIAMLVDKHGTEGKIGDSYVSHTQQINEAAKDDSSKVGIEWFDFHKVCAGMKFENVSILMETLKPSLSSFGMTIEQGGRMKSTQSGVLRTNCMDCLDRTNVVQSATAQRALETQLAQEGIELDLQADNSTQWFNSLWADNGDAISKQYSSTAALKGDFTRTRKRDYRGALNDFGLTLTRYYNNIVNDYFSQAAIDFLLGNVTDEVFEEFESNMMSSDPGVSMKRVRQNAIDTSAKIVIEDDSEELSGGWTLATPQASNTLRTFPFEEIILLLTDAAIYAVRFDWNTEKVSSFERIEVQSIVQVRQGLYVTNTLTNAQVDPQRNVGLVITYKPGKTTLERVNTRSMSTAKIPTQQDFAQTPTQDQPNDFPISPQADGDAPREEAKRDTGNRVLALKALPSKSSVTAGTKDLGEVLTERQVVNDVCRHVAGVVGRKEDWVEEGEIIGLEEARRSTGLLEQWSHSLKKFVWAS